MVERNAGVAPDKRIEFRIGIHLGDVVEESDGDLMGDGVNIAARLEGIAKPGAICLSEDAYRQVKGRLDLAVSDLGPTELKNIAEPIRVYSLEVGLPAQAKPAPAQRPNNPRRPASRSSSCRSPISAATRNRSISSTGSRRAYDRPLTHTGRGRDRAQYGVHLQGQAARREDIGRELNVRYVLEGSVQRGGNRMRVNVQLIDAETGNHLWAERFDKPLADLFDMQDEIVARLAGALNAQLVAAEARRAEQAPNPTRWTSIFKVWPGSTRARTRDNFAQAQLFRSRALRRSRQCRCAHRIGARGRGRGRKFLCHRSDGGLRGGRSEVGQSLVLGPGPCARPSVPGICRHNDQARCGGHRRV